jgi:hypothetical protein
VARGNGASSSSASSSSSSSASSCALLLNNAALASFSEGKPDPVAGDVLELWLNKKGGGSWERVAPSDSSKPLLRGAGGEERAKLFVQAVAKGLIDEVNDFDDHLLDLKKDWLNPGLLG